MLTSGLVTSYYTLRTRLLLAPHVVGGLRADDSKKKDSLQPRNPDRR
jgi:hypothetical protein